MIKFCITLLFSLFLLTSNAQQEVRIKEIQLELDSVKNQKKTKRTKLLRKELKIRLYIQSAILKKDYATAYEFNIKLQKLPTVKEYNKRKVN